VHFALEVCRYQDIINHGIRKLLKSDGVTFECRREDGQVVFVVQRFSLLHMFMVLSVLKLMW
jgi:outer membrane lipoprotein SlyB